MDWTDCHRILGRLEPRSDNPAAVLKVSRADVNDPSNWHGAANTGFKKSCQLNNNNKRLYIVP